MCDYAASRATGISTAPDGARSEPGGVLSMATSVVGNSKTGDGASAPVTLSQLLADLAVKLYGPILLAKLPPGTYTIQATYGPSTQTRTVSIPGQGLREAQFRWSSR